MTTFKLNKTEINALAIKIHKALHDQKEANRIAAESSSKYKVLATIKLKELKPALDLLKSGLIESFSFYTEKESKLIGHRGGYHVNKNVRPNEIIEHIIKVLVKQSLGQGNIPPLSEIERTIILQQIGNTGDLAALEKAVIKALK